MNTYLHKYIHTQDRIYKQLAQSRGINKCMYNYW